MNMGLHESFPVGGEEFAHQAPIAFAARARLRAASLARAILIACAAAATVSARAMDVDAMWDFAQPQTSEQRFRSALAGASVDEALILQTQIARTYGLRGDFAQAQSILNGIEPQLAAASAEARARHALETGRTLSSAAHSPDAQTPAARTQARAAYLRAFEIAKAAHLDGLAVDALHMVAFVDAEPAEQLKWGQQALAYAEASPQPGAKKWEASLRNNVGYALRELGRYDEALAQFEQAVVLRQRAGDAPATREAQWMVARTLRALDRNDEALASQLRLEVESDAAGAPDPEVFEELEILYRARGDEARALHYAERRKALPQ